MQKKKLKLLCMHGFGTNKEFMKMQSKAVANQLSHLAEFYYADGPNIIHNDLVFDKAVFKYLKGSPRSWFNKNITLIRTHEDIMEALEAIRISIESICDSYDGAFCFSQGSMAFQFISMYHKLGYIKWKSMQNIRFFMNFSSVAARLSLQTLNWERFEIPSLHILSEQDIYFKQMMLTLTRFKNPEVIFHTFGHKFPLLGLKEKRKIVRFMKKYGFNEADNGILNESRL